MERSRHAHRWQLWPQLQPGPDPNGPLGNHVSTHDHVSGPAHNEALVQRPHSEQECHRHQSGRSRRIRQENINTEQCANMA